MTQNTKNKTVTVHTEDIKSALVAHYATKPHKVPKQEFLDNLYKDEQKNFMYQPLNKLNLIKLMRYIKKNHIKQADYPTVIDKLVPKQSLLTQSKTHAIFNKVAKYTGKVGIKPKVIISIFNDIISGIKKIVSSGNNVCLSNFGTFKGVHKPTKKYHVPVAKGKTRTIISKAHIKPKFSLSAAWKRALKK